MDSSFPQVVLLHGPRGAGKVAFALETAKKLLSCDKKEHPDLHHLFPDPESDSHPIAAIRQLIAETVLPPFSAPCKVFIIHDAEKMLPASSNALLKTLEEPPADTRFILTTTNPAALFPTVLSRCAKIAFSGVKCEGKGTPLAQQLLECRSYVDLHTLLSAQQDLSMDEADSLFQELLDRVKEHNLDRLEEMVPLIGHARQALQHNMKLKHVLEWLLVQFNLGKATNSLPKRGDFHGFAWKNV